VSRPGPAGRWLELAVSADSEAVEAVSEILARVAPGGVVIEPAFELLEDGLAARPDPTRPAIVRAYLPAPSPDRAAGGGATARALEQVRRDLGHLQAFNLRPVGELATREVDAAEWATAWKASFPLLRIGGRIVIRPPWRRHRARGDEVVVALDPGVAFGTGLHPTTRLCLLGLEAFAADGWLEGRRVLDVGCGSGILALAALGLGAAAATGIDRDPLAIEATRANARRNRVARRVVTRVGSLPVPGEPFEVVVANLVAAVLIELAAGLYAATCPGREVPDSGGRLLAGGIFADREAEVRRALAAAGFRLRRRWTDEEWVALEAERL
jgi:ribosomal protein L11 methyltransferase